MGQPTPALALQNLALSFLFLVKQEYQGQAIVDHVHCVLKACLHKTKKGNYGPTPRDHLSCILYI